MVKENVLLRRAGKSNTKAVIRYTKCEMEQSGRGDKLFCICCDISAAEVIGDEEGKDGCGDKLYDYEVCWEDDQVRWNILCYCGIEQEGREEELQE